MLLQSDTNVTPELQWQSSYNSADLQLIFSKDDLSFELVAYINAVKMWWQQVAKSHGAERHTGRAQSEGRQVASKSLQQE